MPLSPLVESFVLHFGEMGSRWGINRTVGQIYALLYVADRPLPADEITEMLRVSRSNVSMGLKELQSWNLVRLQHIAGDRRDYFSTPEDIWQIVRTLAEQRRRREVDPTLSVLRDLIVSQPSSDSDRRAQLRLREMQGLSYSEIAEALGVPQGTVESRLHRARADVRRRLQGYES